MRAIMLASACGDAELTLHTTYMPYSRQDRVCSPGEADGFQEFQYIMSEFFDNIITVDLHNPNVYINAEAAKLGPDYSTLLSVRLLEPVTISVREGSAIVAPDHGAIVRAEDFADQFGGTLCTLNKERTPHGIVQSVEQPAMLESCTTVIIVDDICDGGATFLNAAEEIRKYTQASMYLIVSHGIFSAGTEKLLDVFADVYVLDNNYNRNRLNLLKE